MKKYDNLWDKICTIENFKEAYKAAIKGKTYYTDVRRIERYGKNKYLRKLLDEVKSGNYKVSKYKVYKKFTGGKLREIWKLPMRDRIVQHAIMRYIEPIFRETFIVDTFSSIKGRGIHRGLKRVRKVLNKYDYKYCLELDIHKCYPSLDQNILKEKLARKFVDKKLLNLLYVIIDSCEKGVPIGNYTSQYFNNFYFSDFDHWIKEEKHVKGYFRYCDDIRIFSNSKEELRLLLEEIKEYMNTLNVNLKSNYQITNIEIKSVNFLGYKIRRNYVLVRNHTKHTFIKKVTKMDMFKLSAKDVNVLGSYWGIFVHANCRHLWFKYTKVKQFKDLNVKVHERDYVRDILDIPIIITASTIFLKKGQEWLRFECTFETKDKSTNETKLHKDVIVSTSAEKLVEAGKQFKSIDYPFQTTITVDNKKFYNFI